MSIFEKRYLVIESRSKVRAISIVRLIGRPRIPEVEVDQRVRSDRSEYLPMFSKLKDLFSGLQKRGIPCIYTVLLKPIASDSDMILSEIRQLEFDISRLESQGRLGTSHEQMLDEKRKDLRRLYAGKERGFFQTEVLFFLWADGDRADLVEAISRLENNVNGFLTSVMAVFPEMEAVRLEKKELLNVLRDFFSPFPSIPL